MRKILPFVKPSARAYQFFAFPLAIMETEPRTQDWVLSNFIQLEYDKYGQDPVPFCFYLYDHAANPWLEVIRTTREWSRINGADAVELARNAVAANFYAHVVVDEFYIPRRLAYGRTHLPHDLLIHGVDDGAGLLHILGFDEQMEFGTSTVTIEEFRQAYGAFDIFCLDYGSGASGALHLTPASVFFYRLCPTGRYALNLSLIERTLREYLGSVNSSQHFEMLEEPWDRAYGVACYDHLAEYLNEYLAGARPYDIRHLHLLFEHKRLMTRRVGRLMEFLGRDLTGLVDAAARVEAAARGLRNGMIMHGLRGGSSNFSRTGAAALVRLRDEEVELLEGVLAALGAG